jgi:hypothetical protein
VRRSIGQNLYLQGSTARNRGEPAEALAKFHLAEQIEEQLVKGNPPASSSVAIWPTRRRRPATPSSSWVMPPQRWTNTIAPSPPTSGWRRRIPRISTPCWGSP